MINGPGKQAIKMAAYGVTILLQPWQKRGRPGAGARR